ncbi:hypothetical protein LOS78_12750 [Paracoccus sp. MA]|uniref:hypothetical protein n=1 Tax=Paracoccus sp. MA TaxID=2895796 RepID=UPI001E5A5D25|nr:hypothetical protein [Paracoccus sp. MA]UFM66795.1 hypothetical protein LOS78_12750 [Paracoccus sp. MA]
MKRYKAAQTLNMEPLPIVSLDWASGTRIAAEAGIATASGSLPAGAYMITATAPIMLRGDGQAAGQMAGSIYIAAGLPVHLMLLDGPVSVYPVDSAADVYVVPLS